MPLTLPASRELGYAQATADQTFTAGAGAGDVTGLSVTFVATAKPVLIEIWFPQVQLAGAGSAILFLAQDGTALAQSNRTTVSAGNQNLSYHMRRRISTLTVGTSYTFKAQSSALTVNHTIKMGTGAGGGNMPGYIRAVEC